MVFTSNEEVKAAVGNTPHMTLAQADRMTCFIAEHNISRILELGFRHGVSTCYMASALSRAGGGSIVTIDLESVRRETPNIEDLLEKIGERRRVSIYYEPTSYTWRLMHFLKQDPKPEFDLCYIDGAHSWFVDGLAFFLVDRLLRPGGWIILDDLDWTYETSPALRNSETVRLMPEEEKKTPQVKQVYELLVKQHPGYHNFRVEAGWGYAQKKNQRPKDTSRQREIVIEQVVTYVGLLGAIKKGLNWFKRQLTIGNGVR